MPRILEPPLRYQEFFHGLAPVHLDLMADCAVRAEFDDGEFLFREGTRAEAFFLIDAGGVALEIAAPGNGALVVQTLGAGDVAGFSWLIEPHVWTSDGRAVGRVRAIQFNGGCLRAKCAEDTGLGYELMRRFAALASGRLQATRLQLLDVYGHAHRR